MSKQSKELQNWKDQLTVSHRKYDWALDKNQIYKDYYRGDQWYGLDSYKDYHHVVDNIVFSNIRAQVPRLIFKNPRIFVSPKKKPYKIDEDTVFDTIGASMMMEILMNWYFKRLDTKRELRRCLYDALLGHWGIMELGYTVKTEKVYKKSKQDILIEVDELIQSEEIFIKRRSMEDFRSDVEGTDHLLRDSRWIALKWIDTLEDVKNNSKFENTSKLKANFRVETDFDKDDNGGCANKRRKEKTDVERTGSLRGDEQWDRVLGWTIWDKKLRRRYDVVEEHDKFLSNDKWPTWMDAIDGFPVEMLHINENPDELFPLPDIEIYRQAQDEINLIGTMQLDHIDSISERRYLYNKNVIEEKEIEKLLQNGRALIGVDGNTEGKVEPLSNASISQDLYIIQRQKKAEIAEMAGVTPAEKGAARNFETATEPALLNIGAQTIRADQRSLVEDFTVRIVKKASAIVQQTIEKTLEIPLTAEQFEGLGKIVEDKKENVRFTREFVLDKIDKITSKEGHAILQPWLNLSKDDIKGDYDFDIEVGSMQPDNEETRKRDTAQLSQFNFGNPAINQREWTRKMNEAFDRKDVDEYLKSPEEIQQQQQQAIQAQQGPEIAERQIKSQTDLAKTKMKTDSAEKQTAMKVEASMLETALKESSK
jgi:hypothetical protein